jgi:hypothetical protein
LLLILSVLIPNLARAVRERWNRYHYVQRTKITTEEQKGG